MFQSACLCIQIIPGNPQVLDFHFLCCCRCVAPVGECGIDAFLVDVYPFQLFVDKGNGGFQFSLFFLRQTVVARSLRQAVNKGEGEFSHSVFHPSQRMWGVTRSMVARMFSFSLAVSDS